MSAMLENVIKRFEQYDEMSPQELLDEQVRPLVSVGLGLGLGLGLGFELGLGLRLGLG